MLFLHDLGLIKDYDIATFDNLLLIHHLVISSARWLRVPADQDMSRALECSYPR